jgi:hypothetical protein
MGLVLSSCAYYREPDVTLPWAVPRISCRFAIAGPRFNPRSGYMGSLSISVSPANSHSTGSSILRFRAAGSIVVCVQSGLSLTYSIQFPDMNLIIARLFLRTCLWIVGFHTTGGIYWESDQQLGCYFMSYLVGCGRLVSLAIDKVDNSNLWRQNISWLFSRTCLWTLVSHTYRLISWESD